jgi:hypothetical protein
MLNNAQSPTTNEHRSINQTGKQKNQAILLRLSSALLSQKHEVINVRSRRRVEEAKNRLEHVLDHHAGHSKARPPPEGYSQSPALSCKLAMPCHVVHPHNHHRR